MNKYQVDWVKCVDVWNDEATVIVGKINRTVTRTKNVSQKNVTVEIAFYITTLLLVRKRHRSSNKLLMRLYIL